MLVEDIQKAWRIRSAACPIAPRLCFSAEGLVLGAGTVLQSVEDYAPGVADEARLLTLLSAAYGRPVRSVVLGHLRRAVERWSDGETALADLHLALTGLPMLSAPREAARRLFMADLMMKAGTSPDTILKAMGLPCLSEPKAQKYYSPNQPRVPAGSGRTSGQWTAIARSFLQAVSPFVLRALARTASRYAAPVVFFAVLLAPTNKTAPVGEYDVPGKPGLRYGRRPGERGWRIFWRNEHGEDEEVLRQADDTLVNHDGHVVGRILPGEHLAIDLAAVSPHLVDENEPRLCPAPTPDNPGAANSVIGRRYENQIKLMVNPHNPTPPGLAVALINPLKPNGVVKFDDCEHTTGTMIEAKGPTFTDLMHKAEIYNFKKSVDAQMLSQAENQAASAGRRPIRWYFADDAAAVNAREIFSTDADTSRIMIVVVPYTGDRRRKK